MLLHKIALQNFRSYEQEAFHFDEQTTIIVGPNTAGKSNLIEAVYLTATGKSFRSEKDNELVNFGKDITRVKAHLLDDDKETIETEVLFAYKAGEESFLTKRYFLNGIPKRRVDFSAQITAVLFVPQDLEIIVDGPSIRRRFLDDVLEQTDREYRLAVLLYTKALRQRNALISLAQETGVRKEDEFSYWDELLIRAGNKIEEKREQFILFVNEKEKEFLPFVIEYDKSIISKERLLQYRDAEIGAGVTLVGPHRDDFSIHLLIGESKRNVKAYGSRGQQRLAILELKILQIAYIEEKTGLRPILLLDDIFSELDDDHIALVLSLIGKQQTILTTTHEEFIKGKVDAKAKKITL